MVSTCDPRAKKVGFPRGDVVRPLWPAPAFRRSSAVPGLASRVGVGVPMLAEDFYTFTGTGGKGFDIVINADRKLPRSTLDSRISLFDLTAKKAAQNVSGLVDGDEVLVLLENATVTEAFKATGFYVRHSATNLAEYAGSLRSALTSGHHVRASSSIRTTFWRSRGVALCANLMTAPKPPGSRHRR